MKGYWHLVDAILASLILVGFMVVVAKPAVFGPGPDNLNDIAYELLKGLDDQGYLRPYAASHDFSGLDSKIRFYSHNHSIQICDHGGSCFGSTPSEKNIWVASYLVSGYSTYQPMTVRLYVWE